MNGLFTLQVFSMIIDKARLALEGLNAMLTEIIHQTLQGLPVFVLLELKKSVGNSD